MKTMRLFCLLCTLILLASGCGKPTPSELKNLAPVKITVVRKGEPLADVLVQLVADSPVLLARGGVTDANGVVVIETKMQANFGTGVQPGTYTVTLAKDVPLPSELQERENEMDLSEAEKAALDKSRRDFYDKNRLVPLILTDAKTSPIRLSVAEKTGAAMSVDVAEY